MRFPRLLWHMTESNSDLKPFLKANLKLIFFIESCPCAEGDQHGGVNHVALAFLRYLGYVL